MTRHPSRVRSLVRWRNIRWVLAAALLPAALWACTSHPLEEPEPAPETQTDLLYEVNPLRQLDLLFVVDDSGSMAQEQANLERNFPDFMRELERIPGGLPDMHVAVVSSNFGAGPTQPSAECYPYGQQGKFVVQPNCGFAPGMEPGMEDPHYLTINSQGKNFDGELPTVFGCLAKLGINGCGYEHQLQSMRFALGANHETNKGFLRPDAYLGIVILSDEDDCSGEPSANFFGEPIQGQAGSLRCALKGHVCGGNEVPAMNGFSSPLSACTPFERSMDQKDDRLINVSEFVEFVRGLKGGRTDRILVSTVIGWDDDPNATYRLSERPSPLPNETELDLEPACQQAETGSAAPGIRLHAFAKSFPNNTVHSICSADLKQAMTEIGATLANILANTCITQPLIDADGNAGNGIQADCQVVDREPNTTSPTGFTDKPLPRCDLGGMPCWELMPDATCTGSGYKTVVRRDGMPPPNTLQSIKCLTCTEGSTDPRCIRP